MTLDDRQIEQYSRQIILAEVGPEGQERLLAARVAIVGDGDAARRLVAYLAAAGVGRLAATPALHGVVDPDQRDTALTALPPPRAEGDVVVLCDAAARDAASWSATRRVLWIADGVAAEIPPCPACVAAAGIVTPPVHDPRLTAVRDGVLGATVATEVAKTILGIGAGLRGRILTYDADRTRVATTPVAPRLACPVCAPRAARA